jgi:hypothetical protein
MEAPHTIQRKVNTIVIIAAATLAIYSDPKTKNGMALL